MGQENKLNPYEPTTPEQASLEPADLNDITWEDLGVDLETQAGREFASAADNDIVLGLLMMSALARSERIIEGSEDVEGYPPEELARAIATNARQINVRRRHLSDGATSRETDV